MSGRIPKLEGAANEVGKPSLFADLAFTEQRVNCKHRRSAAKRPVDERSSVICEASLCTYLFANSGETLGGFSHLVCRPLWTRLQTSRLWRRVET